MGAIFSTIIGGPSSEVDNNSVEGSRVIEFHSSNSWQLHYNESKQSPKLIVVYFSALTCGPCSFFTPFIQSLSAKCQEIDFIKIDVDELQEVAQQFAVQAMPTIVLLKQGKEVERVVGGKKDELERKILNNMEAPKFAV